jgi:hypothetical protein
MPHPNHVVPQLARKPLISDNLLVSFKLGALLSFIGALILGTWWTATQWNTLQNRLNTIERTQAWQTAIIQEHLTQDHTMAASVSATPPNRATAERPFTAVTSSTASK